MVESQRVREEGGLTVTLTAGSMRIGVAGYARPKVGSMSRPFVFGGTDA
jgi:hypothetical protein